MPWIQQQAFIVSDRARQRPQEREGAREAAAAAAAQGPRVDPGARAQVTTLVKGISPDEYDAAAARTPALCPLRVMGDFRSGRELLADVARDRALPLSWCPPPPPLLPQAESR